MKRFSRYKRDNLGYTISFLDLLCNWTLGFALLFCITLMIVNKTEAKPGVQMKAEFVLTLSWPDESFDDQDIWVLMPNGQKVGYSNRDIGIASLDRDDMGCSTNFYLEDGEVKIARVHRELVAIRSLMPGRYVVNVFTFSEKSQCSKFTTNTTLPYKVTLEVTKLNPSAAMIARSSVIVEKTGDQKTFLAFNVNDKGEVTSIENDLDEPFVGKQKK